MLDLAASSMTREMDSADHATEQITGPPNKTVESIQPDKNSIVSHFPESRQDSEEASRHLKLDMEVAAKNSPVIEFRHDSPAKEGYTKKLTADEYSKMSLGIIDNREDSNLLPRPKVSFRSNRDSPTPDISCAQHLNLPKRPIREFDNGGGIIASILSAKPRVKKGSKIVRPSVFERLARTETVAFIHQKFRPVVMQNRSTSAPPLLQRASVSKVTGNKDTKTSYFAGKVPPTKDSSPSPTRYSHTKPRPSPQKMLHKPGRRPSLSSFQKKSGQRALQGRGNVKKNISTRAVVDANVRVGEYARTSDRKPRRPLPISKFKSDFEEYNTKLKGHKETMGCKSSLGDSFYSRRRSRDDESIDSYDMIDNGPPLFIEFSNRTKIICSNKYAPELGFEDIDPQQLGIRRSLTEYEAGSLAAKKLASEIMHALLWRDLPKDLKWNINFPLERELAMPIGEIGYSFFIEATETRDDSVDSDTKEDIFHTASATGNVSFLPDRWEVHVENYSCVHDVDEDKFLRGGGVDV